MSATIGAIGTKFNKIAITAWRPTSTHDKLVGWPSSIAIVTGLVDGKIHVGTPRFNVLTTHCSRGFPGRFPINRFQAIACFFSVSERQKNGHDNLSDRGHHGFAPPCTSSRCFLFMGQRAPSARHGSYQVISSYPKPQIRWVPWVNWSTSDTKSHASICVCLELIYS